ncbi:GGDEF domain-containing protein [Desulfofundulus salinus]|uniref:GGDEF domain-containing protein n=1 Tax=Desulfofundulus salinus TaxID=2419843 RepID=A0A494WWR0_9FIRM|nr:GGDEF domain-containing protein [Desulfofundulus salinum]RKO67986.1 GGDEF domain-containing protein [Desulfofundulus salinum]
MFSAEEKKMEKLYESLDLLKSMYQIARVVDPVFKKVLEYKIGFLDHEDNHCYDFWQKGELCENCISMKAYNENDIFIKMEYLQGKIYMITAVPLNIENRKLVLEMLKDITGSIVVSELGNENNIELENYIKQLNELAIKDSLTGIFNRRYINERLPAEMIKSGVAQEPLSIIMADIDHFKKVNDNFGHTAGDHILKEFALLLEKNIRSGKDWVARYGGEEFLVCLTDTSKDVAKQVAERMRKATEEKVFEYAGINLKITASFGVCTAEGNPDLSFEGFLQSADKNLYTAKKTGRNRVIA